MAQRDVVAIFVKELERVNKQIPTLIGSSQDGDVLDVTFQTSTVVDQFEKGIVELLKPLKEAGTISALVDNFEQKPYIKRIVEKTIKTIRATKEVSGDNKTYLVPLFTAKGYQGPGSSAGSYLVRGGGSSSITFRFVSVGAGAGTGANDTRIRGIVKALRDNIYNTWLNENGGPIGLFGNLPSRGSKADELTDVTQIGHENSTTRGALALQLIKKSRPSIVFPYNFTAFDVVEQIQKNLQMDVDRNYVKNKIGKFEFRYKIDTQIMENFTGSEDSDFSKLKERQVKQAVNDLFMKNQSIGASLLNSSGSRKPIDIVVEDTVLTLLGPLTKSGKPDMRFKKNQKFKKLSDTFNVKKATKYAPKTGAGAIALTGVSDRAGSDRPEKNKREGTQAILKLQSLINKRLPAQVRRNMGKPALTNRTGIFSNSAELVNLRQTKAGLSGEYTYMLTGGGTSKNRGGVYETFENTGVKNWSSGYNPKPLIAKSIRDLAMQYTEQKLVSLRRI